MPVPWKNSAYDQRLSFLTLVLLWQWMCVAVSVDATGGAMSFAVGG